MDHSLIVLTSTGESVRVEGGLKAVNLSGANGIRIASGANNVGTEEPLVPSRRREPWPDAYDSFCSAHDCELLADALIVFRSAVGHNSAGYCADHAMQMLTPVESNRNRKVPDKLQKFWRERIEAERAGRAAINESNKVGVLECHLGIIHGKTPEDLYPFDGDWDALVQYHGAEHETGPNGDHLHPDQPDVFNDYRPVMYAEGDE